MFFRCMLSIMEDSFVNMISRKQKLEKSIKTLEKRMEREKKEYDELCIAIDVMQRFGVQVDESGSATQEGIPATIGDMALEILKEYPDGLTASQILKEIQDRWKPELVRTSLSPPLSRLKEKELIEYIDSNAHWRIPKNEESSSAVTLEPSGNFDQGDDYDEDEIPF